MAKDIKSQELGSGGKFSNEADLANQQQESIQVCCEAAETRQCFTSAKTGWGRKQSLGKKYTGLPWSLSGKESTCDAGDLGSVPGLGRSPGEGNGYPLQYSCLDNPIDRGAWWATIHGVMKSWMTERHTFTHKKYTMESKTQTTRQQLNIK